MTSGPTPAAAWEALAAAIAARDADSARRATTAGAWRRHGDSALVVYETAAQGSFRLAPPGPAWIEADRAVLPVAIEAPGRSTTLYALLEQRDGAWSVSAGVRDERHASLFLAGVLPAVFEVSDLGPSPEGEPWARARSEELLGVHALPARHRVVVGLRRRDGGGRPVQEWVCLDTGDGVPREIGRSSYPSLGLLLTGLHAALPARAAPVSGAEDERLDAEGWKIIQTLLLGIAELARAAPPLADEAGRVPGALTEAFARALETAGRHPEAAALRQRAAARPAGASTARGALEPVRDELQRELEAFRKEKGLEPAVAVLDESFLAEHGQELAGRLLRVLAGALPLLRPMVQDAP